MSNLRDFLIFTIQQQLYRSVKLHELRQEIQKGIDSSKSGKKKTFDVEEVKAEGRKRMAAQ